MRNATVIMGCVIIFAYSFNIFPKDSSSLQAAEHKFDCPIPRYMAAEESPLWRYEALLPALTMVYGQLLSILLRGHCLEINEACRLLHVIFWLILSLFITTPRGEKCGGETIPPRWLVSYLRFVATISQSTECVEPVFTSCKTRNNRQKPQLSWRMTV